MKTLLGPDQVNEITYVSSIKHSSIVHLCYSSQDQSHVLFIGKNLKTGELAIPVAQEGYNCSSICLV